MASVPWSVRRLSTREQQLAVDLFEQEVSIFTREQYESDLVEQRKVSRWMTSRGISAPLDTWMGVLENDRLVAAAHAGPHYGQARDVLQRQEADAPTAWGSLWLQSYLAQVANLDDIAVAPDYRRRGIASALVRAVCADLRDRGAHTVAGFASGAASMGLFKRLGFTIGQPRESVPEEFANGLRTFWYPGAPVDGRYFWKRLAYPAGASFIRT
ncbi:GNAT family N-acetyltransferase [Cellulomonas sp. SG140]|uniref:GNAT family N-acetyltransferase n=1 Tax=Cellulomonas sp. SG140 TaxID=2976536 RepID=UPI0021E76833|nr:GNAT family N-acetyltransferase [Cellulomonas sp. SG140]